MTTTPTPLHSPDHSSDLTRADQPALRAAIYCRVSTDEQADRGTSLTDQQRRCIEYAESQNWDVVARFVDDGASGATLNRPALRDLTATAESNRFDRLIVTDPDRLSRDLVDGLIIERDLTRNNIDVVYLIQPTMGVLERQIRGIIAEEERRKIRERTSRGLRARAESGDWAGGPPPYGYLLARQPSGRNHLQINPVEATVITTMINQIINKYRTTSEVAAYLNKRGVPTPTGGRSNGPTGAVWSAHKVRSILITNKAFTGTWHYQSASGTVAVAVPPIITNERLEILHRRLNRAPFAPTTRKRHYFMFARRIMSPCGRIMTGNALPDNTGRSYECPNRKNPDIALRCDCKRVHADLVETRAWDTLEHHITNPDRLLALTQPQPPTTTAGTTRTSVPPRRTGRRQERAAAANAERVTLLADSMRLELEAPTPDEITRVLNTFDITIIIEGHTTCPTCHGKGLLPNPNPIPPATKRRRFGIICPTCARRRHLPTITITGTTPTNRHTTTSRGTPFTLRLET